MKKDKINNICISIKSKPKNKRIESVDTESNNKLNISFYKKLAEKINKQNANQNITHINNLNIVNMIVNKDYKIKNSPINSHKRAPSHIKSKKKIDTKKNTNNLNLLNQSNLSEEDLPKYKTNKFLLYSPYNHTKIVQVLKDQKKFDLIKSKPKNRSCRNLSNVNLELNCDKKLNKKSNKNCSNRNSKGKFNNISTINRTTQSIRGKLQEKINREYTKDNFDITILNSNTNINMTYHTKKSNNDKISQNINDKYSKNNSIDENFYLKDISNEFNMSKETENKYYIDSEINKNKDDNESIKMNVPYEIKVNLTKYTNNEIQSKNISSNFQNTKPFYNFLNNSIYKNNYNLIRENAIKIEIRKSNIQYINKKKKIIFDNDDEIIDFIKNKFKDKNSKYLSELQSKNYVRNIFDEVYNNAQKKKGMYSGLILSKRIKGKTIVEIELENNLESINKVLRNEKLKINNDLVIMTRFNYMTQLKEDYINIKYEYNKIKEENKNIYALFVKLKEENFLTKIKFGKLKSGYDNLCNKLKLVNDKNKEYNEELNKKNIKIKELHKKTNDLEMQISELNDKSAKLYNINNIISKEIQMNINNKKEKKLIRKNNNFIKKSNKFTKLEIEKVFIFKFDKARLKLMRQKGENKFNNIHRSKFQKVFTNNIKMDVAERLIYIRCHKLDYNKSIWICDDNIEIIKNTTFEYINNNKAINKNVFISQKENEIYFEGFQRENNQKIKFINNFIELQRNSSFNFIGLKMPNYFNNNLRIDQMINFFFKSKKDYVNSNLFEDKNQKENNKGMNLILEHISDLCFVNNHKIKNNKIIQQISNIYFEGANAMNKEINNNINDIIMQKINVMNFEGIKKDPNNLSKNLFLESIYNLNYEGIEKRNNKNEQLIKEKINNFNFNGIKENGKKNLNLTVVNILNIFFEKVKKEENKLKESWSIEVLTNLYFERVKQEKSWENKILIVENISNIKFEQKKKTNNLIYNLIIDKTFCISYEKVGKNRNVLLNIEKVDYLYFDGIKQVNKIRNNLYVKDSFCLSFEGMIKRNKNANLINLEKVLSLCYEGKNFENKMNNNQIEHIQHFNFDKISKKVYIIIEQNTSIYFEKIKKENIQINKPLSVVKNDLFNINSLIKANNNINKSFNNNFRETVVNITFEKTESIPLINIKKNEQNKNKIEQNIIFSILIIKKSNNNFTIKKFDKLEISKDTHYSISIYKAPIESTKIVKIDTKFTEQTPLENPKKEIKESSSNQKHSKVSISSKAINRIKKKNKAKEEKSEIKSNTKVNPEVLNALESLDMNNKQHGELKYRKSFRIMEIAKNLEREITKQSLIDNKVENTKNENINNNIKNNNVINIINNNINNNIVDILSKKPVSSKKKKKKNKIDFKE